MTARRFVPFSAIAAALLVLGGCASKVDLKEGAPVMVLDPHDIELSGNVSGKFRKAEKVPF